MTVQMPDGSQVRIVFKHEHFGDIPDDILNTDWDPRTHERTHDRGIAIVGAMTTCRLLRREGEGEGEAKELGVGVAWCAIEDHFRKETGRVVALKRAVEGLPRDLRGKVLQAYYSRPRGRKARA